jgi:hypothetical protein
VEGTQEENKEEVKNSLVSTNFTCDKREDKFPRLKKLMKMPFLGTSGTSMQTTFYTTSIQDPFFSAASCNPEVPLSTAKSSKKCKV